MMRTALFWGAPLVLGVALLVLPTPIATVLWWSVLGLGVMVLGWGLLRRGWTLLGPLEQYRGWAWRGLWLVALAFVGFAAWDFSRSTELWDARSGARWLFLAVPGVALALALRPAPVSRSSPSPMRSFGLRGPRLMLAVLCFWLVAEINTGALGIAALWEVSHHWQAALWGVGFAALAGGARPLAGAVVRPSSAQQTTARPEPLLLALICLFAFALRIWDLEHSLRVLVDEMHFVNGLTKFWYNPAVRLYENVGQSPFPQFYTYAQAWSVELFGPSFFGFRFPSAVLGTWTVAASYVLARALFDRPTGYAAALLVASLPLHVHFSRLGLLLTGDAFAAVLALGFLAHAWRTNQPRAWLIGGIGLGLTSYFHESARLLIPPVALAWLGWGWLVGARRPAWRGLVLAGLAALLVAGPVYYRLLLSDAPLVPRFDEAGQSSRLTTETVTDDDQRALYWERHLGASLRYYVQIPPHRGFFGGPQPILPYVTIPFFMLGLAYCVWRWRSPAILLAIWWAANTLGNSLLVNSVTSPRYVASAPALALLIAVGLRQTAALMPNRRAMLALLTVATVMFAAWQTHYYFGPALTDFNQTARVHPDATDAILRSLDLPPQTQIHLVGEPNGGFFRDWAAFFRRDLGVYAPQSDNFGTDYINGLSRQTPHAIFLTAEQAPLARALPPYEGPFGTDNPDIPPDKIYFLYYLPPR